MPQAGWCRECGEWVWVDEEGACQYGHGPECVGGIYDAQPQDAAGQSSAPAAHGFGQGDMPDSLYRFHWAAFALPFFWGIAYGVWPVVTWWLFSLVFPIFLAVLFGLGDPATGDTATLIGILVASETVSGLVRLWAGVNGTSLLWRREALRLEFVSGSKPRFSVERYLERQRVWIVVGWIVLVLAVAGTVVYNYVQWTEFGMGVAGAVEPLVFMGAQVWLGVWLALKMREERPAATDPSQPAEHTA